MLAQFYSPIIGGEERHVQDLSIGLVKRGHDVVVATIHTPGSAEFELDHGIGIYRVKSTMQHGRWLYSQAERSHAPPFPDPEVMLALQRIIASEKPQIVHAHNWILNSFLPLKAWSRVPLVLSVHDYSLACVQKRLMYFGVPCSGPGFAKCMSCASNHYGSLKGKATTLSHRLMNPVVRAAVDIFLPVSMATAVGSGLVENRLPFEVIPNFVPDDIDSYSENVDSYVSQLPEDGYLLFVGDLSLDKGIGVLLRAYEDLQNPPPLVLIGRSNKNTPTKLPENVFLMNSWPHAAVMEAWRRSSIALAPSVWSEPFGIVAIEALSMGRPVIASRIGGLTDIVKDGETGFLIPPGDSAALTQAMKRLIDDKPLRERMSVSALRRAQDFRASVVIPRIEAVYRKLTENREGIQAINEHNSEMHWQGSDKSDPLRNTITCPYCQASVRQNKAGRTRVGSQRYRCMQCHRTYTPKPRALPSSDTMTEPSVHRQVDEDVLHGIVHSLNATFRTVGLRTITAAKALRSAALFTVKNETLQPSQYNYEGIEIRTAQPLAAAIPGKGYARLFTRIAALSRTDQKWGWLPQIALLQSCSLLLLAWTFVTLRAGAVWAEAFFWICLAMLIAPVAIRLYSSEASRSERIGLILLLGVAFYLVKVMHSPYAFTFADEFSHLRNVLEILGNQRLFEENPELPVTALYPGLATITSLLVSFSGLSPFAAGLLVIGAARLVLFLGLFLLYEQVSGSARIAGLATLFYMANTNFLFFTAQFSYESLALPIAIFVLYIAVRRETTDDRWFALTVVALLGGFMVVISHHMTSYILVGLLFAATGISIVRTQGRQRGPWDLALITALATSFWLFFVATYTLNYLPPVFLRAVQSVLRLVMQEESSRQLFKSTATGYVSSLWEQLTVFGSLLITVLGLPIGLFNIWRRYRNQIFFLLLSVLALGFLPMQGLRLTSAGWETANRSSEFLFIGVAFVLALAIDQLWRFGWIRWGAIWIQAAIAVVLIFGGFIAGWPPQARMPRPYLVDAGSHIVEPQSIEIAKWMFDYLGPNHRVATSRSGAKVFSAYGQQAPFTGDAYGIKDMLFSDVVGPSQEEIIRYAKIEYIASDRLRISWDTMIGFFFLNRKSSPSYELLEFETFQKFDGLRGVNRILDSGNIVIYDTRVYLKTSLERKETLAPTARTQFMQADALAADQSRSANGVTPLEDEMEDKHHILTIDPHQKN